MCQLHYGRYRRQNSEEFAQKPECSVEGCTALATARGWCATHYARWQRNGDPVALQWYRKRTEACVINDPECEYGESDNLIKGMCQRHYMRLRRSGTTENTWRYVECVGCGEIFEAKSGKAAACSDKCYKRHVTGTADKKCLQCDASIKHLSGPVKYCEDCAKARARDRRAAQRQSRSRHSGRFIEHVAVSILAERDGFICQLCDSPVDMEQPWPGRWSPSVDHVVPISLGGEHSYANTQLAHLTCNIRKGNRVEMVPTVGE